MLTYLVRLALYKLARARRLVCVEQIKCIHRAIASMEVTTVVRDSRRLVHSPVARHCHRPIGMFDFYVRNAYVDRVEGPKRYLGV